MLIDLEFTAQRVKLIRVRLGLSQVEFGRKIGVDADLISRYERGLVKPTQGRVLGALLRAENEADGVLH